jgi:hypothetical protein
MLTTSFFRHFRRAFDRTVRAENTAIARVRLQKSLAFSALVKENARIRRHFFFFLKTA